VKFWQLAATPLSAIYEECAIGFTKVAFWKSKKVQDPNNIFADADVITTAMNVSAEIKNIFEDDHNLLEHTPV